MILSISRTFATNSLKAASSEFRAFNIYRFNPDKDIKPHMESYAVNTKEYLLFIIDMKMWWYGVRCSNLHKREIRSNVNIQKVYLDCYILRRSCREGICGSCSMNINGQNGLACITPITESSKVTTIRPLPHMFVIKDLVIGKYSISS